LRRLFPFPLLRRRRPAAASAPDEDEDGPAAAALDGPASERARLLLERLDEAVKEPARERLLRLPRLYSALWSRLLLLVERDERPLLPRLLLRDLWRRRSDLAGR
jgi:hypothetical protein